MSHIQSVLELASIFSPNNEARPTVLLGAGASFTSGVPLREHGLMIDIDGTQRPTNAAILLFGADPQRFFPHAVVTVTVDGKKRRVIDGNLLKQRTDLLDWIGEKDVNPTIKIKTVGRHVERPAYHERALIELVVNLLVHRDYEDHRPSTINVDSGGRISFFNPGRPPQPLTEKLSIRADGIFEPVRELTSPRRGRKNRGAVHCARSRASLTSSPADISPGGMSFPARTSRPRFK